MSLFTLERDTLKISLKISLPQGLSQKDLIDMTNSEIDTLINSGKLYGKDIKIFGRITTGMALVLGHKLAHVCNSVSIFDPKLNDYILCIRH